MMQFFNRPGFSCVMSVIGFVGAIVYYFLEKYLPAFACCVCATGLFGLGLMCSYVDYWMEQSKIPFFARPIFLYSLLAVFFSSTFAFFFLGNYLLAFGVGVCAVEMLLIVLMCHHFKHWAEQQRKEENKQETHHLVED